MGALRRFLRGCGYYPPTQEFPSRALPLSSPTYSCHTKYRHIVPIVPVSATPTTTSHNSLGCCRVVRAKLKTCIGGERVHFASPQERHQHIPYLTLLQGLTVPRGPCR